ncbi:YHS domain-containing protein [candidate division WOR-3 bacterium]|nr:YHS domain-containing protein [candidate division WOR-3 bacterium]
MKPILLAAVLFGLAVTGMGSAPPAEPQRSPLVALGWLEQVTLEVTTSDSGAVIALFARDPAALKAIRDYVAELNAAASPTAIDPVCGMEVSRAQGGEKDLTATHQGRVYYFCNAACRSNFLRQPARFTKPGYQAKPQPGHGAGGN